jgi:hypothetical protein
MNRAKPFGGLDCPRCVTGFASFRIIKEALVIALFHCSRRIIVVEECNALLQMRNTQAVTAKGGKWAPDMRLLTIPEVRALGPEAVTVRC